MVLGAFNKISQQHFFSLFIFHCMPNTQDLLFEHLKKAYPTQSLYEIALWTQKIHAKLSKKTLCQTETQIPKEIPTVQTISTVKKPRTSQSPYAN